MADYPGWCFYACFSLLVVFLSGNIFVITFKIFLFAETKYEGKYSADRFPFNPLFICLLSFNNLSIVNWIRLQILVVVLVLIQREMDNVRKFVGLNTQIWTKQELVLFLPLLNGLLYYKYQLLNIVRW
jgi:hypothetical protein